MKLNPLLMLIKLLNLALLLQDEAGEIIENNVTIDKERGLERLRNIEARHNDSNSDSGDSTTGPDRNSANTHEEPEINTIQDLS